MCLCKLGKKTAGKGPGRGVVKIAILQLMGCLPPGKFHLIRAPEVRGPPQGSRIGPALEHPRFSRHNARPWGRSRGPWRFWGLVISEIHDTVFPTNSAP